MEIRKAKSLDAQEIANLEKEIFSDAWRQEDITSCINSNCAMCYVAIDNNKTVGYIIGNKIPPEAEIYRIATSPDRLREGIGTKIFEFLLGEESPLGITDIFLEVREKNSPAIGLYEKLGFSRIDIRKNYYKNPDDNAIIMLLKTPR